MFMTKKQAQLLLLAAGVLMLLFGLGGTTYGMWEETMAFYPLLIPVFLAAGYDAVVGITMLWCPLTRWACPCPLWAGGFRSSPPCSWWQVSSSASLTG